MRHSTRFLSAAALALITGSALAVQPQTENAPLRGPQVRDAGRPDRGQPADEMAQKQIELPFQAYVAALRSLQRGEDESLRLTAEQAQQIRQINQAHREATREFMEQHREEIQNLRRVSGEREPMAPDARPGQRPQTEDGADRPRRQMDRPQQREQNREGAREGAREGGREGAREGGRENARPGAGEGQTRDGMQPERGNPQHTPEERAKAAERLRELMLTAPQDKESKKQLMGVLTKAQQERVEAAIEAQRQRIREGRPPAAEDRPGVREGQPQRGNPDGRARPGAEGERPQRRPGQGG